MLLQFFQIKQCQLINEIKPTFYCFNNVISLTYVFYLILHFVINFCTYTIYLVFQTFPYFTCMCCVLSTIILNEYVMLCYLLAVCATFDVESLTHYRWYCSVKHLTTENVMFDDLCKRPVVNLPIVQVSTWRTAPSLYLWSAVLLLRSCTFGNWKAISWTSLRYNFNLKYYPIISCRGNVLSGKRPVQSGKRPDTFQTALWPIRYVYGARKINFKSVNFVDNVRTIPGAASDDVDASMLMTKTV